jgi:hypothetical protein
MNDYISDGKWEYEEEPKMLAHFSGALGLIADVQQADL